MTGDLGRLPMIRAMDSARETVLRLLDAIEPVPTGPVRLSREYLESVARVQNHPDNQSGADKSWVAAALRRNRAHFERARLR